MEVATRIRQLTVLSQARLYLAMLLNDRAEGEGRVEAKALVDEIVETGQVNPFILGQAHVVLALVLLRSGKPSEAEPSARTGFEILAVSPTLRVYAAAALLDVLLARGQFEQAERIASEELLQMIEAMGGGAYVEVTFRLAVAKLHAARGAQSESHQAITSAHQQLQERAARIPDPAVSARFLTRVPANAQVLALARAATPP